MIGFDELSSAIGDLDEDVVTKLLNEFENTDGEGAAQALAACQEGMEIVGGRFESGEYYVADLIFAGELMEQAANVIKPFLAGVSGEKAGKMILCTVKDDIHDIGKNIVKSLLEAGGIEVVDLGVDVAPETIVSAIKENDVRVLALSGVLTLAIESMKKTVEALEATGLRDKIKVIVGGAPVTADYCRIIGADAWSINAAEGVTICRNWLAG